MANEIHISETQVGLSINELVEDRFADVVRHYEDSGASGKSSTITLTIVVTPDERRQQFQMDVSAGVKFSPRKGYSGSLYAGVEDGVVKAVEYNPQQLRMFDGPTPP